MPHRTTTSVTTNKVVTIELTAADIIEYTRDKWPHLFDDKHALISVNYRDRNYGLLDVDSDTPVVVQIVSSDTKVEEA